MKKKLEEMLAEALLEVKKLEILLDTVIELLRTKKKVFYFRDYHPHIRELEDIIRGLLKNEVEMMEE